MPTPVSATDTVKETGEGPSLAVSTRGPIALQGAGTSEEPEPPAASAAEAAASAAEAATSAADAAASSVALEMDARSVILPPGGVNLHALDRRLKLHLHGHVRRRGKEKVWRQAQQSSALFRYRRSQRRQLEGMSR
jgi:hypothetical protein